MFRLLRTNFGLVFVILGVRHARLLMNVLLENLILINTNWRKRLAMVVLKIFRLLVNLVLMYHRLIIIVLNIEVRVNGRFMMQRLFLGMCNNLF